MKPKRPSRFFTNFFLWYCNPRLQESILGDLEEQFDEDMKRHGSGKAQRKFIWNVLKFFRPSIIRKNRNSQKISSYGMIKHNLKVGWRNILRKKTSSLINVLGLSTGTAACLITLIFYQYETSFDHYHERADQTYRIVQHTKMPDTDQYWNTTAYPLADALRNDFPDFEKITQVAGPVTRLFSCEKGANEKVIFEESNVLFADSDYPQVFDLEWIAGDPRTALDEINSIIITKQIFDKCFGLSKDPAYAIGKTLLLNDKDPLVIRGVIENNPANSNLKANMIVAYSFFKKHNPYPTGNWSGNYQGTTFVVLQDFQHPAQVESKINHWKSKYLTKEDDQRISYYLQPLKEIHTETKYGATPQGYQIAQSTLDHSLILALFILLIAIANFINLITASAASRAKEVGIRKMIGGRKRSIVGQFIIENALLTCLSILVGLGLTYLSIHLINEYLTIVEMQLSFQPRDFMIVLVFCFIITLLATIYPSLVLSSFQPIKIANQFLGHSSRGIGYRKGLTLFQFTVVQVFVISAIIVGWQLHFFENKSLGFDSHKIISIPLPSYKQKELLTNQIRTINGVEDITVASGPPMAVEGFALGTNYRLPHQQQPLSMGAEMKIIDSAYLSLYNIPLIAGRNIKENKPRFDEFIINMKLANSLNWTAEEAIGKRLAINEGEATIVGVVGDFHNHSLQHDMTPVILMNWQSFQHEVSIKISSFSSLIRVEEQWRELFPNKIFSYHFVDDAIKKEYIIEDLVFTSFKILSALVISIGCLGLLGLMSFITSQKTKEVGIRKVLGASAIEILTLLNKQFTLLILIAFVIAVPVAWYFMDIWLNSFKHRVSLAPWMFVIGGAITLILGFTVSILKSYRIATINPVESLRDE